MSKRRVDVRVDEDLLKWADGYADDRRWTRTAVFEAGLEALRGDSAGGVPDPPAVERSSARPQREQFASGEEWQNAMRLWRVRQG
jgi:hypothetical protein